MGKLSASEFNNYYTRLLAVRQKFGEGTASYPTVSSGTKATSATMTTLKSNMQTVANGTSFITGSAKTVTFDATQFSKIMTATDTQIKSYLSTWEATCAYNANCDFDYDCHDGTSSSWDWDNVDCYSGIDWG